MNDSIMRVCMVANSPFTLLNFRLDLIKYIVERGHRVILLCPASCNLIHERKVIELTKSLGVELIDLSVSRAGVNPYSEAKSLLKLAILFRKFKPTHILNYTVKANVYGGLASYLVPSAKVYANITGLGYSFSGQTLKQKTIACLIKLSYRLVTHRSQKVFFQNQDDVNFFVSSKLIDPMKVALIPGSGVNTKKFTRKNFNTSRIQFLFVGRLLKDKGIYEFISASKLLASKYNEVTVSIVGHLDDNPNAITESELENLLAGTSIQYLGGSDTMVEVYENHNVFVLPSYREGKPKAALEAMSMSMPIVITDAPGCKEVVEDSVTGFKVAVKDDVQLYNAMERFVLEPELITSMGRNCREVAESLYDSSIVVNQVYETLKDE
ncbi:glycosyltransferase family 4 protein [Vibrio coralliilyticus]|nr:glycosyltransferase family 4 protein [Vibrio coralliilyticus]NOH38565.1 glycosyltransferase family 4 protein [Vibrio coralliilyticus]